MLVGDYLLSKGLLLSIGNKDFRLLELVSEAVKVMSEGELLQIEKARRLDITEDIYYEIIRRKTVSASSPPAAPAGFLGRASDETVQQMHRFGELIGIAFQIKDDLFDYGPEGVIGKPTGIDIKESKMTAADPRAVEGHAGRQEADHPHHQESQHGQQEGTRSHPLRGKLRRHNLRHRTHVPLSGGSLPPARHFFPANAYRDSLRSLVRYTTERPL